MYKRMAVCCLFFIAAQAVNAGRDPVSWQLTPSSGFDNTIIGSQSTVTYTLTSHLPGSVVMITSTQINGPGITVEDGCNQVKLAPNGVCNITVHFTPTAPGDTTFQLTYGYNFNRIPVPRLVATATGQQSSYSLSGSIPNFEASIAPAGTHDFSAVFTNSGSLPLTNCYAGDTNNENQFVLSPTSTATLTVLTNSCGTASHPIGLSTTSPSNTCTITGSLTSPYQQGNFTLSSLMHCAQAGSDPTVSSTVATPTIGFTGVFTEPSPFPATIYDNEAPFLTTKFTNTGNVPLTNCAPVTTTGFSLSTPSVANIVTTSTPSTCGSSIRPRTINANESCYLYGQLTVLQEPTSNNTLTASVACAEATAAPTETFATAHSSSSCTSLTIQPTMQLPTSTYLYADVGLCNRDLYNIN